MHKNFKKALLIFIINIAANEKSGLFQQKNMTGYAILQNVNSEYLCVVGQRMILILFLSICNTYILLVLLRKKVKEAICVTFNLWAHQMSLVSAKSADRQVSAIRVQLDYMQQKLMSQVVPAQDSLTGRPRCQEAGPPILATLFSNMSEI